MGETALLDNVARFERVDRATLFSFAERGEPMVLARQLDDAPIASIDTLEAAREAFGGVELSFRPEYTRSLMARLSEGPPPPEMPASIDMAFDTYYRQVEEVPDTPVMCVEQPTPAVMRETIPTPSVCSTPSGETDSALKSTVFAGNAGNFAPLHYDGDCRHVLLYQVFGKKRVYVIAPEQAPALRPIVNFATLHLPELPDDDKRRLLEALGAWETILEPGDAILMPALVWHGVDYLDHGMSINFRFGRHRYHRFVSEHLHLDERTQRFAWATLRAADVEGAQRERWERLVRTWAEGAPTPWAKYERMVAVLDEICAELAPVAPAALPAECFPDLPDVVAPCLRRMHLFNERLYRHRNARDPAAYLP